MVKSCVTVSLVPEIKNGPWIYHPPLDLSIRKASDLGFDAIELFTISGYSVDPDVLGKLLKTYNIKLAAVGTGAGKVIKGLTLTNPNYEIRTRAISYILEMIEFGAAFGAPAIIGSMQGNIDPTVSKEEAVSWLIEGLDILGAAAEHKNVELFFEPLNRYETNLVNNLEEGTKLMGSLKTRNITLLADLFHMNIEERSIPETIIKYAGNIGHIHFADSNRRSVGMGHISIKEIADTLKNIDYQRYISAEALPWPYPDAAALQTIKSFREYFGS